ncbi:MULTISPECIES: putative toxin-antitoxin system toxin component, PIN family [unclassified Methylophilus]|uniref:Toxin-antitoxin system toxin component, PIN family n=1 Tax=Methylophilus glucosoxydans TaxID=752553 RepID=A0ABW3GK46_9PROT|nr:putative toxin-antitoxin system toxin component, PIN family [Methylophilus sp. YYY-1]MDF0379306.1 putative toxin-antitoxin system toxin component, PIN family [Methylophilus sp. YYY-1]BEV09294.1 putative toxin-antitoxin system toxin component, PIN family [Methylophilus sp. DW102]
MSEALRVVCDTNTLISYLLLPNSVSSIAVRKAFEQGVLLVSESTLNELADVLSRPKFDRYISLEDRQAFFRLFSRMYERVNIVYPVNACRDPKDNQFLEVAVNGGASMIITGDADLLVLHPFQGISILTAAQFNAL